MKTDGHSDADELVAYYEGTLSPVDMQRVQDHLLACRECAELVVDLEGLGDPEFGTGEVIPDESAELVWKNVRQQIRRDERPANVVPFRAVPRWVQPLAAMLLISTLALSGWVAWLRGQVRDLSSPQLNAPVLDLYPAGSTRGEGPAFQTVPPEARLFTVILNPADRPAFDTYELEILDSSGGVVWRDGGLKPNPYGSFSVTLPRDLLGTGDFRVRLVGIDSGGGRQTVEEYALRIDRP
jgi:hypothetical protein